MVPCHNFLWADRPTAYQEACSIDCLQVVGGTETDGERGDSVPEIIGMKRFELSSFFVPQTGTGGPVPAQVKEWQHVSQLSDLDLRMKVKLWDPAFLTRFHIDGQRGEVVTQVHVSTDFRAIKLVTNRERECCFGTPGTDEWHVKRAGDGEAVAGLSCCFGRLAGWSRTAKMYSHLSLSDVGVFTMKMDKGEVENSEAE
jgi:hypothetical protein